MTNLSTEVVPAALFTRQDFDQAMEMFQHINQDIYGNHPEYDDELKVWMSQWQPVLSTVSNSTLYYITVPVDDAIVFSPPDVSKCATLMYWPHNHPLLLVCVAMLINLCQCERFAEISAILHYFRGNRWARQPVDMPRPIATVVRDAFYRTLEQLIDERRKEQDES